MSVGQGHPDWQSYASWRGSPIVSNSALGLPGGGQNLGITPIPHWSSLTIRASATNRNVTIIATFYADAGGTFIVQQVAFTVPVGCLLSVNVPALGPFVQIIVNNLGAAGGSMGLFVEPSNLPTPRPAYIAQVIGQPLVWGSAVVGAGGNVQFNTTEVWAGQVVLFAGTSSGTAHHGLVNYWDQATLSFLNISAWNGPVDGQRVTRYLAAPASQIQVSGNNDDTVNRTLTLALIAAAA